MLTLIRRLATRLTHRIYALPIVVLMPHSRCNCRCVMCDIWRANHEKKEISLDVLQKHIDDFRKIGVKHVTLSGGEALMHTNLWLLCDLLRNSRIRISLLTAGISLDKHAADVLRYVDDVIVSLDGPREVHDAIRNIPQAFEKLSLGIESLRQFNPEYPVTGRCVIQKRNYKDFKRILETAKDLKLNQISFLPADVSSQAFNREQPWDLNRAREVALDRTEIEEFKRILEQCILHNKDLFSDHRVAESPAKLLRMVDYFRAVVGDAEFESPACNAPWVSAVVEANGDIRPCFFQAPYGNLQDGFERVLNAPSAVQFRKTLNVETNPTCQKCVCSLRKGLLEPA